MQLYKRYIDVVEFVDKEGNLTPLFIIWDNGIKYPIDKIIEVRQSHSQVGGAGLMYRCRIQNQERKLFYERNRWFIESFQP